jgi:DNA-binding transcriptional LysR family regulator
MERLTNVNGILAFATVAREGSVSRAAEVLNLTQPALSHQIKRLSTDLGVTLFTRSPRGLVLTPDGTALLPLAEQVLAAMSDFHRRASTQFGELSGKLKIGTIVDPEFIRLGRLLSQLGKAHPKVTTELVHGISGDILRMLKGRQLDAGFYLTDPKEVDSIPSTRRLHTKTLAEFSYRVIAPPGWEAQLASDDWAQLAALPWIGTSPASAHHRLLANIFARHGCQQKTVALVDHEASMLEMVRSGVGLSLCRESIALHERQSFGLTVCEGLRVPACLLIIALEDRMKDPVVAALFEQVQKVW